MRSIRALALKECRQHLWPTLALTLLLAVGLGFQLWYAGTAARSLSLLTSLSTFLLFFVPLAALILSGRFIIHEYQSQTQLFIESLPIRRMDLPLVKYGLGLIYLLVMTTSAILMAAGLALNMEPISPDFLVILIVRATLFVFAVWSFFFAMGFMGRFRLPIYIGICFALLLLHRSTELDIMRVGPLALVDPATFPFERQHLPWVAALQTLVVGTGCMVLAGVLALIHEGSVAETLARKMTQREKVMVSVLCMGAILGLATLEMKKTKAPYQFESPFVVRSQTTPVAILYSEDHLKADALQLLRHLESSLHRVAETLTLNALPPLNIAFNPSLDQQTYEQATLQNSDGVLVRANFASFNTAQIKTFEAYVLRAVLEHTTRGRAHFEPKRWLHDGFTRWWVEHGMEEGTSPSPHVLLLRALSVMRNITSLSNELQYWAQFREQHGAVVAESLAYSGLRALEAQSGRQAVLQLARAIFSRSPSRDGRETVYEWFHPMAQVVQETTGIAWTAFVETWQAWLHMRQREPALASALAALPSLESDLDIVSVGGGIREIRYQVRVTHTQPQPSYVCAFLHRKLSPFDREIEPTTLKREEFLCDRTSPSRHLRGRYSPGDRLFIALEIDIEALQTPLRILSRRVTIQ